jgi:hypothetical protein
MCAPEGVCAGLLYTFGKRTVWEYCGLICFLLVS